MLFPNTFQPPSLPLITWKKTHFSPIPSQSPFFHLQFLDLPAFFSNSDPQFSFWRANSSLVMSSTSSRYKNREKRTRSDGWEASRKSEILIGYLHFSFVAAAARNVNIRSRHVYRYRHMLPEYFLRFQCENAPPPPFQYPDIRIMLFHFVAIIYRRPNARRRISRNSGPSDLCRITCLSFDPDAGWRYPLFRCTRGVLHAEWQRRNGSFLVWLIYSPAICFIPAIFCLNRNFAMQEPTIVWIETISIKKWKQIIYVTVSVYIFPKFLMKSYPCQMRA